MSSNISQSVGNLYIVSTPIGNMQDITLRALEILKSVDEIICEDTRVTGNLLKKYDIQKKLTALNDFNEELLYPQLVEKLLKGASLALVSDAGTPLISDPGFKLVREAKRHGITLISIPGANAIVTALTTSALPPDKFLFLGFLNKSEQRKQTQLEGLKVSLATLADNKLNPTVIFYDTPHDIEKTLRIMHIVFGNIDITLARELTKLFEECTTDTIENHIKNLEKQKARGEFVVLFNLKN